VRLAQHGVKATLSLCHSPKIPADLIAEVRSVSAIGELYVDLRPRTRSGPYLHDGSVIARADTELPAAVGPMLDKVSALIDSIPKARLRGTVSTRCSPRLTAPATICRCWLIRRRN